MARHDSVKKHLEGAYRQSRDDDRALAELARRQHGVVSRRQLEGMGFGRTAIRARLHSGRLHRLHPGVYAVGHRLIPKEGWLMAAVLASGPRFAPFLRRHRLPMPRFNEPITLGTKRYRVDCHWPGTHQIVELDGWEGHSSRSAFRDDRERDRRLRVAGYSVTRLTWNQLEDEPTQIAADLRALLEKN
ncbi:MAG TPA: type IV toxin-antitoxin system AbiEi family antitoxin domain-containing protein [Solirubrobacterales bacterium]|nr:type IV toxin-antitoxin system AbiEi family antitoxin domain-containing protein [Solirubrobacterales bacterium]